MAITLVDTATGAVGSGTEISIAKADLSGLANGHFVLIYIHCDVDIAFTTIPTGFTKVDERLTTTGRDATSAYFYKAMVDVDNEPASWVFTHPVSSEKTAVATAWSGVATGDYLDASGTFASGTPDQTPDCPDITTVEDGAMIVAMLGLNSATSGLGLGGGAPSGMTLAGAIEADNNDTSFASVAYLEKVTAGLQVLGDWTTTPDEGLTQYHTRTISLTPAGGTIWDGVCAMTAAGVITAIAGALRPGVSSMSGAGVVTSAASAIRPAVVSMSGSGTLTSVATTFYPAVCAMTGSGTLTSIAGAIRPAVSAMTGSGVVTAAASAIRPGVVSMAGSGTLTSAATTFYPASCSMAGTGTLTSIATTFYPASCSMTGTGTLTSAATAFYLASCSMAGSGTLTAVTSVIRTAVVSMTGTGTLTASASIVGGDVLSRAEAYWRSEDYSGSGDLLDGSAAHDAVPTNTIWLDYSTDEVQYAYFPGSVGNEVSVAGLSATTPYDYTVTYLDDSSEVGEETTDGAGNLVLGNTQANFSGKKVKTIVVVPDGGGATQASADFTDETNVAEPFASFMGGEGKTWTFGRSATGVKLTVVDRNMFLLGANAYFTVADHADLDFDFSTDDATMVIVVRGYGNQGDNDRWIAKGDAGDASPAVWHFKTPSSGDMSVRPSAVDDDSDSNTQKPVTTVTGELVAIGATFDYVAAVQKSYKDGVQQGTDSDISSVDDCTSSDPLLIGAYEWNSTIYSRSHGEFVGAAIFREALSEADVAQAGVELLARVRSAASSMSGSGTLTAPASAIRSATVSMAGSGTVTAVAGVIRPAASSMSGSGTLTAPASAIRPAVAAMTGSGTLTSAATAIRSAVVSMTGTGTLTASATVITPTKAGVCAMAASGTVTVAATAIRPAATTMTGAGTLTIISVAIRSATVSMTASGTLTVGASLIVQAQYEVTTTGNVRYHVVNSSMPRYTVKKSSKPRYGVAV